MILDLPYPPAANNLHAVFKGRKILSMAGRNYYALTTHVVASQMRAQRLLRFKPEQRLTYSLDVFPPDKRRRDLSNVLKAFEDALTKAGVWADDSQVDEMMVRRRAPCKGGKLCVVISERV